MRGYLRTTTTMAPRRRNAQDYDKLRTSKLQALMNVTSSVHNIELSDWAMIPETATIIGGPQFAGVTHLKLFALEKVDYAFWVTPGFSALLSRLTHLTLLGKHFVVAFGTALARVHRPYLCDIDVWQPNALRAVVRAARKGALPALRHLTLHEIGEESSIKVTEIMACTQIESIKFKASAIWNKNEKQPSPLLVRALCKLPRLRVLNIEVSWLAREAWRSALQYATSLTDLRVQNGYSDDDTDESGVMDLRGVLSGCAATLQSLHLGQHTRFDTKDLANARSLKSINVQCYHLTIDDIQALVVLPALRELHVKSHWMEKGDSARLIKQAMKCWARDVPYVLG